MAKKISVKNYTGVYFSESTIRKWREQPDRGYWVAIKDIMEKILFWQVITWIMTAAIQSISVYFLTLTLVKSLGGSLKCLGLSA
jgi:hypothetical protein